MFIPDSRVGTYFEMKLDFYENMERILFDHLLIKIVI